ncbi:MAG: hypothetical protein ACRDT2_15715 [Natronosporangium sp.]
MGTPVPPPPDPPRRPPEYRHQLPPGAGGSPRPGDPDYDPLVPPPGPGLSPLYERLTATLGRSFRTLGVILLLTFALPQFLLSLLGVAPSLQFGQTGFDVSSADPDRVETGPVVATLLIGLLVQLLVWFVNAVGWGAGIWAVTREAAGQPAPVGAALQVGLRRSGPMFGGFLLLTVMVLAGLLACVLPGLYLAVAGSLFSFVVIYERGRSGIGRSFGLVHRQFGAALGRVLLLVVTYLGVTLLVSCLLGLLSGSALPPGTPGGDSPEVATWLQVVTNLIGAAVDLPMTMLLLVGTLLTYTQLRARKEPLSTGQLQAAADQAAGGAPVEPGSAH